MASFVLVLRGTNSLQLIGMDMVFSRGCNTCFLSHSGLNCHCMFKGFAEREVADAILLLFVPFGCPV